MSAHTLSVVVVVGNPKATSRTSSVGTRLGGMVAAKLGIDDATVTAVELSTLTGGVFAWGDEGVAAAKAVVMSADLLIVISPVFKGSFTGLTKAFLDHFDTDELAGKTTIPAMMGGGPDHRLAMDMQLRPVLIEIGASCPTRGFYVTDSTIEALPQMFEQWWSVWGSALTAALAG